MRSATRSRGAALAGAALLAILTAVAALLAVDVDEWGDAIRDGDLQHAAGDPSPEAWDRDPYLPGDAAERLLGLGDDLAFRRAVALFGITRAGVGPLTADEVGSARERALGGLTEAAADHDHASRAAQAANLAGILAAESSPAGASETSPAESFRASIALDPDSEHAKRNLERLLRTRRSERRAEAPTRDRGQLERSPGGAGLSPPGEGY